MKNSKNKSLLDSVHGYIYIDSSYFKDIIDTPIFQRLRRIEQTSFRGLCPSARHDRFIHSVGVYHMGAKMFQEVKNNLKWNNRGLYDEINNICKPKNEPNGWDSLNQTFEIACLLHDCGHAPFSHTFEKYYVREKSILIDDIIKQSESYIALDEVNNYGYKSSGIKKFQLELETRVSKIKEHELASAWLVIHEKGFRQAFIDRDLDPILAIRMITGCKHLKKDNFKDSEGRLVIDNANIIPDDLNVKQQIENCFISLLNGHIIDADRLDYFARDRWATGLNTSSVDISRLLSSITIEKNSMLNEYVVCVNKRAIPELKNIVDVKEFLDYWIINHHKVVYDNKVLVKAVAKLSCLMCSVDYEDSHDVEKDKIENSSLYEIFNYKSLIEPKHLSFKHNGIEYNEVLYRTSDDDLVYLMKKFYSFSNDNKNYANEWLHRSHQLIPLWKSYAEFIDTFKDISISSINAYKKLISSVPETVTAFIDEKNKKTSFNFNQLKPLVLNQKAYPCLVDDDESEPIYINTGKNIVRYSEIPHLTGRFKLTSTYKGAEQQTKCSNMECTFTEKACNHIISQESFGKDRYWEYFYLFLPRIYKGNKQEMIDSEYNILKSELIMEIKEKYKIQINDQ
ncbi:HD domain-containing protein [Bacteroidales bacterium OttesenSCG-928-K03]|nr:HD domain-containing protein [Odoribacter sp. OttesenSCG-928-L07]MDL2239171.1 HD domain-containing protein [Bacteroidales bacterium OttesenSCG-928-L14]MDL2240168.1 HD domain-containing protein [Bacteroidales bacterium OttesenSCG-928-K22]MDL2242477.1 HD domain-containing protein [Bacteroidales bacterium OttesenSCG-928-K03]